MSLPRDRLRCLLSAAELHTLTDVVCGFPNVLLTTPQLHISGLLSNGIVDTLGHV